MSIFKSIADSIALKAADIADEKIDGIEQGKMISDKLDEQMSKKLSFGLKYKIADYLLEIMQGIMTHDPMKLSDMLAIKAIDIRNEVKKAQK